LLVCVLNLHCYAYKIQVMYAYRRTSLKKSPKFLQLQRIASCTVNLGHGADAISYKMAARNHLTVTSDFFPFPSHVTRSPVARPAASLAVDSSLPRPPRNGLL
jgi:hypothetical protein